jgi:hypothetical protein
VLEAAFRRCGVLRVQTIADLFYMAEVLAKQPRPKGPRLAIVTNAGGPGVLAADGLLSHGGQLAQLSAESMQALNELLPPHWSHNNPIDVLGDALPERFAKVIDIAAHDPNTDGNGGAPETICALDGQAGLGQLDGRLGGGSGDRHPEPGRDSDFSFSRHRGAHVLLHVALQLCAARIVRDAGAARRR